MADLKETNIILARENKQEAVKLLEFLNDFSKVELTSLLMFVQGVKFSKQLKIQPDRNVP